MKPTNGKLWGKLPATAEIEFRSMAVADLEDALSVLDKTFFSNESVCIGCEINLPSAKESRRELRELCRIAADDGVSIVAKHATSGKVVGVAFNKIQFIPENNEDPFFLKYRKESTHTPQAQCLMDFMIDVDSETDVFDLFKLNSVCELTFLAVLPEWERKGIGRGLANYTIALTRQLSNGLALDDIHPSLRKYRPGAVTALFTSQFSQKVGKSQGFKVLNSVPYTRFHFNGKSFDQRINPMHKACEHVAYVF